jgi:hypothetical protein
MRQTPHSVFVNTYLIVDIYVCPGVTRVTFNVLVGSSLAERERVREKERAHACVRRSVCSFACVRRSVCSFICPCEPAHAAAILSWNSLYIS